MSADGKIATRAYDLLALGTATDRRWMSVLRARADAVVVGGRTFRNWPLPLVPDAADLAALRAEGFPDCEHPPIEGRTWWNVVVTRGLDVPRTGRYWSDPRVKPLFLTTTPGEVPRGEVEVHDAITVSRILDALRRRGCERVLVEAGGDLIYQFLAADAVDELYLTICPLVVGGAGAPSPVDGPGFAASDLRRLRLEAAHRHGDELYCRYAVPRRAAVSG